MYVQIFLKMCPPVILILCLSSQLVKALTISDVVSSHSTSPLFQVTNILGNFTVCPNFFTLSSVLFIIFFSLCFILNILFWFHFQFISSFFSCFSLTIKCNHCISMLFWFQMLSFLVFHFFFCIFHFLKILNHAFYAPEE